MKTLSLIFLSVVTYVAVSVEPTVPVADQSENADQNLKAAETISTIKDELIIPTDGRSKPSLTTIGGRILGLDGDYQIAGRRQTKKRPRKCQSKADDCKHLNDPCKKDKDCCLNQGAEGQTRAYCQVGADNKTKTCQQCNQPGDNCDQNPKCCTVWGTTEYGDRQIIYKCQETVNSNTNKQCCSIINQFCPGDYACCQGYCKPNKISPLFLGSCRQENERPLTTETTT